MMQSKVSKDEPIPDMFGSMMQGDSEQLQVLKELFTDENIDQKTELSDEEINLFSRGDIIADKFKLPLLKKYIHKFEKLRVSKLRQGRKEFVETAKNREEAGEGLKNFANMFKQGKI